jgi:hypothetical protein
MTPTVLTEVSSNWRITIEMMIQEIPATTPEPPVAGGLARLPRHRRRSDVSSCGLFAHAVLLAAAGPHRSGPGRRERPSHVLSVLRAVMQAFRGVMRTSAA